MTKPVYPRRCFRILRRTSMPPCPFLTADTRDSSISVDSSRPSMTTRHVSPPLLHLNRAVDVAVLGSTAPNHHSLRCLLLVLLGQVPQIFDLALQANIRTCCHDSRVVSGPWSECGLPSLGTLLALGRSMVAPKRMVRGRSGRG